ncbi:MAG: hypothetical protein Q9187_005225 [Circinaria calcarea]
MSGTLYVLPPEVRKMIYTLLFVDNGNISPRVPSFEDLYRHREGWNLLYTCKAINAEATPIVYGENVFCFDDNDDEDLWEEADMQTSKDSVDAQLQQIDESIYMGLPVWIYRTLPTCPIREMHAWLQNIGKQNRQSIRQIRIQLQYRNFCYYTDEPQIWLDEHDYYEEDLCHSPAGGIFIGKAMELLSRGHGLRRLEIAFSCKKEGQTDLWQHFFREPSMSQLIQELAKLKGVASFYCDTEQIEKDIAAGNWHVRDLKEALGVYKNLQEAMKSAELSKNDDPLPSVAMKTAANESVLIN